MATLPPTPSRDSPAQGDVQVHLARLTDEELAAQIYDQRLTEAGTLLAREELASRGVNAEQAMERLIATRREAELEIRERQEKWATVLRRLVRFPVRTLLGLESPWLVLLVGVIAVYPLWLGTAAYITSLVLTRPLPSSALTSSYAALFLFDVVLAWLAISFWRCAPRPGVRLVGWFFRLLAALMASFIVSSLTSVLPLIKEVAGGGPFTQPPSPSR